MRTPFLQKDVAALRSGKLLTRRAGLLCGLAQLAVRRCALQRLAVHRFSVRFCAALLTVALSQTALAAPAKATAPADALHSWLTSADQQHLLSTSRSWQQPLPATPLPQLQIKTERRYQSMQGFGYTLTGGSAIHLMALKPGQRQALLQELFDPARATTDGLAVSYLRLSLGASDLDPQVFSYNDLPAGETDEALAKFSLASDERLLIPLLKEILAINPQLRLLASPWSPPAWMKTNQSSQGGELQERYFPVYAQYFVKYIKGMAAHGIKIHAITVQNEPLHPGNNPSLLMHAWDQARFVGQHLGPAFVQAGLDTDILIYDHNTDHVEYAITVLNDPVARKFIKGSAFHLYNGDISDLSQLTAAHPDKDIYFTEQWVGGRSEFGGTLMWHIEQLMIGAVRQSARNVLEWNLAADSQFKPHTPGGCTECKGALSIDGQQISRNVAYYIVAHASKIAPPGSLRIQSDDTLAELAQVAYLRPDGTLALLVQNQAAKPQTFAITLDGRPYPWAVTLPARSVLSLVLPSTLAGLTPPNASSAVEGDLP